MSLINISKLLKKEIAELLKLLSGDQQLEEMVRYPLSSPDRPLSLHLSQSHWTMLPIIVCHSICGRYDPAVLVAASVGFFQTAGDVFDDIEDMDSNKSVVARYGLAKATNAATTLLMLGQMALAKLPEKGVNSDTTVAVTSEISKYSITACIGQHRDIHHNTDPLISEENYLKTISMKSAAQVECASRVGAMVATDDQELIDTFTVFGHNLGMAAQIVNDIQGITETLLTRNDIHTRAVTLPVVYALATVEGQDKQLLESVYSENASVNSEAVEKVKQVLYNSGAIHYSVVLMETYRQKALTSLKKAQEIGANVDILVNLLEELKNQ
ncbi:polyprenyl synthetase family protein [Chloroflexota bacterium]